MLGSRWWVLSGLEAEVVQGLNIRMRAREPENYKRKLVHELNEKSAHNIIKVKKIQKISH